MSNTEEVVELLTGRDPINKESLEFWTLKKLITGFCPNDFLAEIRKFPQEGNWRSVFRSVGAVSLAYPTMSLEVFSGPVFNTLNVGGGVQKIGCVFGILHALEVFGVKGHHEANFFEDHVPSILYKILFDREMTRPLDEKEAGILSAVVSKVAKSADVRRRKTMLSFLGFAAKGKIQNLTFEEQVCREFCYALFRNMGTNDKTIMINHYFSGPDVSPE